MGWLRRFLGGEDPVDPANASEKDAEVQAVLEASDEVLAEKDRVVSASKDRVADEFRRTEEAMRIGKAKA